MDRSLTVLAADDGGGSAPDCAEHWFSQQLCDRSGLDRLAPNAQVLVTTPARVLLGTTGRRTERAGAIGSIPRSSASSGIPGTAVALVLGVLGSNPAPVMSSAGAPAGIR